MSAKADLAIGVAMFARSIVACDACLAPIELVSTAAQIRAVKAHEISSPIGAELLMRRRLAGLGQDPGRSRPSPMPIPAPLYETLPSRA